MLQNSIWWKSKKSNTQHLKVVGKYCKLKYINKLKTNNLGNNYYKYYIQWRA